MDLDDEEVAHHDHILRSFSAYRYQHLAANNLRRQSFRSLSSAHQALLPEHLKLLNEIDHCITWNAEFLEDVATFAREHSLIDAGAGAAARHHNAADDKSKPFKPKAKVTEAEMDKVRSTLRQLHRDWSAEGKEERDRGYVPILEALDSHFRHLNKEERRKTRVLVPGCGLGRLPFEICQCGFACQGNEFSLFMLFTSNFILNNSQMQEQFGIYPFCHSLSNIRDKSGALREIKIPDVTPADLLQDADFSMAAGDFIEIYQEEEGQWDAVVTCFFLDTAHNIVQYLEAIASLLKPNGVWINLGPTLWHFENNHSGSIDLPLEQVKQLAAQVGFTLSNEQEIQLGYTVNPQSTMQYTYSASFWTAVLK